ncbi:MAG: shikimate dehydrogenase [Cyanobacteria bacterium]|nr:shikimate dehydrogenase [Cyanobacteriota bacterium]
MALDFYRLGILGYPLSHTLSPRIHQVFLEHFGLKGRYEAYPTPPENLQEQLVGLQSSGIQGLNITIPHKVEILPFLHQVDPLASLIQAVNTVVFRENQLEGFNTDIGGFLKGMPASYLNALPQSQVLVLGAGGACRGVLAGLLKQGTQSVTLSARSPDKISSLLALAERFQSEHQAASTLIHTMPWPSAGGEEDAERVVCDYSKFDLVVNTTPLGMKGFDGKSPLSESDIGLFSPKTLFYDLIYSPEITPFLAWGQGRGCPTQNGLDMLIYQALESFTLWTGCSPVTPQEQQDLVLAIQTILRLD